MLIYQTQGNYSQVTEACEQFVRLLVNTKTDRATTEATFHNLALDIERTLLFEIALGMHTLLGKFILKYQNDKDLRISQFSHYSL